MTLKDGKVVPARQANPAKGKDKVPINTPEEVTPAASTPDKTEEQPAQLDYNVLAHLKKIPALLSVYDVLTSMPAVREALIKALQNPELYRAHLVEVKEAMYTKFAAMVKFTDEDLMLGTTKHNRPLYVKGQLNQISLNRILIDPGFSMNMISYMTAKKLSFDQGDLQHESVIVQAFNKKMSQHKQLWVRLFCA